MKKNEKPKIRIVYPTSEDILTDVLEFMTKVLNIENEHIDFKRDELTSQYRENPELILYIEDSTEIVAALSMKHHNDVEAVVGMIGVDKKRRGFGYGKRLMQKAEQKAKTFGFKRIALGSELESIHFYNKLGYKPLIMI